MLVLFFLRLHTLAWVPASGKLFSFGSGEHGQLGSNETVTVNSPVVVSDNWLSIPVDGNNLEHHNLVKQIASGGDHCCVVTVNSSKVNHTPILRTLIRQSFKDHSL